MKFLIQNPGNGNTLASAADIAQSDADRSRGLLGRQSLNPGEGLWIVPACSVHTHGMQFPIDVLFLDSSQCVLDCASQMNPGGAVEREGAHSVLELPAGCIEASGTEVGDHLTFVQLAEVDRPSPNMANGAGAPVNPLGILFRGLGLAEQYGIVKQGTGAVVNDLLGHGRKVLGAFQGGGQ